MSEAPGLPAVSKAPLSVLLLADDPDAPLEEVVAAWTSQLERRPSSGEILLADAGALNRASEKAEALVKRFPGLRVLRNQEKPGIGAALRLGLNAARHPLVFYTTCDRQYQPNALANLLAEIDKVHLVSGYRRWQPFPRWLHWLGALWRGIGRIVFSIPGEPLPGWLGWKGHLHAWLTRIFFGTRLRDPGCLFCLLRRRILARLPIQSDGAFAHDELIAKANFLGCVMTEVPVHVQVRKSTETPESIWHRLADAHRVLSRPDFGPAKPPAA